MEFSQLDLTPHCHIIRRTSESPACTAFGKSDAAGLIALAGQKLTIEADASVTFWKSFASSFLRALCHIPEGEAVEVPKEVWVR